MRRELPFWSRDNTEESPAEISRCGSVPAGPLASSAAIPAARTRLSRSSASPRSRPQPRREPGRQKSLKSPPSTQKEIPGVPLAASWRKEKETRQGVSSESSLAVQARRGLISCGNALCACFPTAFGGDTTLARWSRRAAGSGGPHAEVPGVRGASASRSRSGAALPGARRPLSAHLSPQVAPLRSRVREDASGTHPQSWSAALAPHPPRAAQPRRCGGTRAPHGHRAAG